MYRLGIWLIALAFVFNGAASYAGIDPAESPVLTIQEQHGTPATAHHTHAKYIGDGAVVSVDHDQTPAHSHSGVRCCGICNVASLLPNVAATPVTFSYAAITFHTNQHDLVGHLVALDPGIPKTVV
jgi:hypothetical protein